MNMHKRARRKAFAPGPFVYGEGMVFANRVQRQALRRRLQKWNPTLNSAYFPESVLDYHV